MRLANAASVFATLGDNTRLNLVSISARPEEAPVADLVGPLAGDEHRRFEFPAPLEPRSYRGKLFQIQWVLRLEVVDADGQSGTGEISLSIK